MIDTLDVFLTLSMDERLALVREVYPGYERLERKLLGLGGVLVVPLPMPAVDYASRLLDRGTMYPVRKLRMIPGDRSACHQNVRRLCQADDRITYVNGYGFSEDGLWRQHSWGWGVSRRIIETTVARLMYFGMALSMDEIESLRFV